MIGLLIPRQMMLWAAVAAALVALGWWLRVDAVADYKRAQASAQAQLRIETIEGNKELRDEIESLDDCGLVNRWSRWLRDTNSGERPTVLRCRGAAPATGIDGDLAGGE